jgi:short-subunit dehydrogenase
MPQSGVYSMSKYAVRAMCEALTAELHPHGVSVTMLSPGFVASEIRQVNNRGEFQEKSRDFAPSWLVMPTEKAVGKMIRAIYKRKRERIITFHGWFLVQLSRWMPWLLHTLAKRIKPPKKSSAPQ